MCSAMSDHSTLLIQNCDLSSIQHKNLREILRCAQNDCFTALRALFPDVQFRRAGGKNQDCQRDDDTQPREPVTEARVRA